MNVIRIKIETDNQYFEIGLRNLIDINLPLLKKGIKYCIVPSLSDDDYDILITFCPPGAESFFMSSLGLTNKQRALIFIDTGNTNAEDLPVNTCWQCHFLAAKSSMENFRRSLYICIKYKKLKQGTIQYQKPKSDLTSKEWFFLSLYCKGYSMDYIGDQFKCTPKYLSEIKRKIMKKLNFHYNKSLLQFFNESMRYIKKHNSPL